MYHEASENKEEREMNEGSLMKGGEDRGGRIQVAAGRGERERGKT